MRKLIIFTLLFIACKQETKNQKESLQPKVSEQTSNELIKSYFYVNAPRGLNVRDINGEKLGKLPNNTKVTVISIGDVKTITDAGKEIRGNMVEIEYEKGTAWVFDGFLKEELPSSVRIEQAMKKLDLDETMVIDPNVSNPILRADFNGDGEIDQALLVRYMDHIKLESESRQRIIIAHGENNALHLIGDEESGISLGWISRWKINDSRRVSEVILDGNMDIIGHETIDICCTALDVTPEETADVNIYWNGKEYVIASSS